MEYARKCNADLLLVTDSDCDRVGIAEHWGQTVRPAKGVQSDRWKSCQISC